MDSDTSSADELSSATQRELHYERQDVAALECASFPQSKKDRQEN